MGVGVVITNNPICLAAMIIGTILPDIDQPNSTLGRYNPFVSCMRHRGHCHSLVGALFLAAPFLIFGFQIAKYVYIGAVVHIVADVAKSKTTKRYFHLKIW